MRESKRQQNEDNEIDVIDLNGSSNRKKANSKKKQPKAKKKSPRTVEDTVEATNRIRSGNNAGNARTNSRNNNEFAIVTYVFLAMFIFLAGYFVYFISVKSEDFINSPYNARLASFSNTVIRGSILSDDGTVLADTSVASDGTETREYPYGSMFAHVVGYSSNGMSGIELDANFNLLRSNIFFLEKLGNELKGDKSQGDNVITTLNYDLQEAAYDGLGDYDGAVVVMEPSTGKVLAMVSKPDFDPNYIESNWSSYTSKDSTDTVLLNRATQGLYPPGSTFKMVTLLEYLQENDNYTDYSFDCNGAYSNGRTEIHCYNGSVHGNEDIFEAFGNSCNSAFANIGLSLDGDRWNSLSKKLLFDKTLPTAFSNTKSSSFDLTSDTDSNMVMQTAIGQGNTLVTPLHMAMIAGSIANNGVLMEPYVIDHTENATGDLVKNFSSTEYGALMSESDATTMQEFMRYVVTNGTGKTLNVDNYTAYGKTGTAEYNSNKDDNHSWFVGYANDENGKEIAIAVIMEGAGSGSKYAVPLAKNVFDTYFQ